MVHGAQAKPLMKRRAHMHMYSVSKLGTTGGWFAATPMLQWSSQSRTWQRHVCHVKWAFGVFRKADPLRFFCSEHERAVDSQVQKQREAQRRRLQRKRLRRIGLNSSNMGCASARVGGRRPP